LNLPVVTIYATDVSADALEVARLNSRKHRVADRIKLLKGDLLEPLPEPVEIIVANLPYVPETKINEPVNFEPPVARDGGPDGLLHVRRLCHQLPSKLRPGDQLLLEIGYGQWAVVVGLLGEVFPGAEISVTPDLAGIDRVVCLSLSAGAETATAVSNGRNASW
jgi:release factor glutamine methyltransferase